jgi:hypothetical protein
MSAKSEPKSVVTASVSALVLAAAGLCAQQAAAAQAQGCSSDYFRLRNQATCNAMESASPKAPSTSSTNSIKVKPSDKSRSSPFDNGVPTAVAAGNRATPVASLGSRSTNVSTGAGGALTSAAPKK